jgi:hypothetical protein
MTNIIRSSFTKSKMFFEVDLDNSDKMRGYKKIGKFAYVYDLRKKMVSVRTHVLLCQLPFLTIPSRLSGC